MQEIQWLCGKRQRSEQTEPETPRVSRTSLPGRAEWVNTSQPNTTWGWPHCHSASLLPPHPCHAMPTSLLTILLASIHSQPRATAQLTVRGISLRPGPTAHSSLTCRAPCTVPFTTCPPVTWQGLSWLFVPSWPQLKVTVNVSSTSSPKASPALQNMYDAQSVTGTSRSGFYR